jgi:hypothetical protein
LKVTQGRAKDHRVFLETPLLRPRAVVELDGLALVNQELERAADRSAIFLVNAGMADLGFVVADKRAYNNSTHQSSADYSVGPACKGADCWADGVAIRPAIRCSPA